MKKRLKLKDLEVASFVTTLSKLEEQNQLGAISGAMCTSIVTSTMVSISDVNDGPSAAA